MVRKRKRHTPDLTNPSHPSQGQAFVITHPEQGDMKTTPLLPSLMHKYPIAFSHRVSMLHTRTGGPGSTVPYRSFPPFTAVFTTKRWKCPTVKLPIGQVNFSKHIRWL